MTPLWVLVPYKSTRAPDNAWTSKELRMTKTTKPIALVTGGNKGIGFEVAKQLAQAGVSVLLGARNTERGSKAVVELTAQGLDVKFIQIDLTDHGSITSAAATIAADYGHLDILINNAGIVDPADGPPSAASLDSVRRIFETNFFGGLAVSQAMIPLLRKSSAGQIVILSSSLGSISMNGSPSSPFYSVQLIGYNASKAALNMLTVQLAQELRADGISVHAVCPGFVDTDLSAHQGDVAPVDAAKLPVELATGVIPAATGRFLDVNGEVSW